MDEIFVIMSDHPNHPRRTYFSQEAFDKAVRDGLVAPGAIQYGKHYPATKVLRFALVEDVTTHYLKEKN